MTIEYPHTVALYNKLMLLQQIYIYCKLKH